MRALLFTLLLATAGCATIPSERGGVLFEELADGVWMHTSYADLPGIGPYPSNGLIVIDGEETILVDSGWDEDQTGAILDWAANDLGYPVTKAIFTHAHDDRMAGIAVVRSRGIETYSHALANAVAAERGLRPADQALSFGFNDVARYLEPLVVFYPGPGHAVGNLVVRVPGTPVLFGGCLVRPPGAKTLGNTADADIENWGNAVLRVRDSFPGATLVIPGHGSPGGRDLLDATAVLVTAAGEN